MGLLSVTMQIRRYDPVPVEFGSVLIQNHYGPMAYRDGVVASPGAGAGPMIARAFAPTGHFQVRGYIQTKTAPDGCRFRIAYRQIKRGRSG